MYSLRCSSSVRARRMTGPSSSAQRTTKWEIFMPGSFRHPREHQKPVAVPENPGKLWDRKPAPGPLQLPPASSGPTILPPLPTASHTAPGRVSDFRFQRNGTVAHASPRVAHGRQKDERRMSSLQMVARIEKREDAKTLNQEFHKSRFDNSWTDPKATNGEQGAKASAYYRSNCSSCCPASPIPSRHRRSMRASALGVHSSSRCCWYVLKTSFTSVGVSAARAVRMSLASSAKRSRNFSQTKHVIPGSRPNEASIR